MRDCNCSRVDLASESRPLPVVIRIESCELIDFSRNDSLGSLSADIIHPLAHERYCGSLYKDPIHEVTDAVPHHRVEDFTSTVIAGEIACEIIMEDLGLLSRTEAEAVLVRSAGYGQLVFSDSSDGEDGDKDRELTPLLGFETPASCYESETVEPEPSTLKADRRRSGPVDYRALNSGSDYRKTSTATAMSGKRGTKRSAAPQPTVSKPQKREKLSNPSSEAGNTTSRSKVSTLSNDKPSTSKAGKSAAPQPMQLRLPRAVARPSTSAKAQETVESEAHSSSSDDDDKAAAAGRATKVAKQQALLLQTLSPRDENPLKSLGASETSPESVVMRRALAPLPLLLSSSSLSLPGEQVCSLPHTLFSLYCHTHQQFTLTAWRAAWRAALNRL